ncbi:hypothetical protein B0T26DRAFT_703855 [Lasiosphaeria miniovina]|uniref:Uncharacterized protein n=1 Tax=Lasiosphaeria miniovina TaxID=1954250 RepID=A0AA40AVG0_9PEZI|nr:uncharacterized protein B0T26DRAFT_703855 [Lasiosphaeria miniovina]KAK0722755.1 hypothetical protein B0T26DRAFT_703855 [Lasiosphaeria miniovina]
MTGQKKRYRKFRFRRYNANFRILIITIPTDLYEALHLGLYIRSATFRAEQGHHGGDSGEGDSTGGPWLELIKSRYSETLPELYKDMRWWFQASNHEVKIVILAKFDDQQHHILLEKWEEEISMKRQSITITRNETTNPVSYNVTRGALVLGFRLLFLRDPGPQEGDFVWAQLPRLD